MDNTTSNDGSSYCQPADRYSEVEQRQHLGSRVLDEHIADNSRRYGRVASFADSDECSEDEEPFERLKKCLFLSTPL